MIFDFKILKIRTRLLPVSPAHSASTPEISSGNAILQGGIIFFILFFCSCDYQPPVKPFIIKYKEPSSYHIRTYLYQYYDSRGNIFSFYDSTNYHIGDTLK